MGTNITGIGNANAIGFKSRVTGGMYFPLELKDALVGVWSAYGKSNNSTDRNIIKNKIKDKGGDFVISNAAFKLNSGFGKYSADFESFDWAVNISQKQHNKATISLNGRLCNHAAIEVDEMKVNIIGNVTELIYWYIANPDDTTRSEIRLTSGINTLPKSYAKDDGQTYNIGFAYISGDSEITIEQIPSFEGAFVTDGIDDLITSTKTAEEMGITDEVTVVSMIHQINANKNFTTTNNLRNENRVIGRNTVTNIGKTGIYGWYKKDIQGTTATLIDNILGDKNDYTGHYTESTNSVANSKFYVTGYAVENGFTELSSVAWYWTIIANKVLTTDQINQVIAYFNLDRTLNPDILCNTIKQGITNENHAEFGDKLIDFSGNGRDIQLNNIAWKGDSGIGKYEMDFLDWVINSPFINERTSFTFSSSNDTNNDIITIYQRVPAATQSFLIKAKLRGRVLYRYYVNNGDTISISYYEVKEGINILPDSADPTSVNGKVGFILKGLSSIKLEQIPSHAGGLCLDGINDFGQFVGDLGLKDYTFIMDREYLSLKADQVPVISSINPLTDTPFIFEHCVYENRVARPFSFGKDTVFEQLASKRFISYQSTYKYNGKDIPKGTSVNTGSGLTIGRYGDDRQYANFAFYFLMLFPYSMSEFLIERQLKKYKLGTLYADMVEFRPIVKSNSEYKVVDCYIDTLPAVVGNYYPINSKLRIAVSTKGAADEVTSLTVNGVSLGTPSVNGNRFTFNGTLSDKSPQKINITIDEYIRYEDIVQPYPVLLRFNDENGNEVSWGGKFRVGSTITRIGSIADPESNLLNGLYSVSGLSLNGKAVTSSTSIVEKQMVFKTTATYLLDNNEPKCILSPRLLRIPNSSYKILGYIPDISGHGNHGKINNSAYAGMSGANGYVENFNNWIVSKPPMTVEKEELQVHISYIGTSYKELPMFEYSGPINNNYSLTVDIQGIPDNVIGKFIHNNGFVQEVTNGTNTIKFSNSGSWYGFTFYREDNNIIGNCNITIEQIGEYEGAYCLDGVDDHITIPTVTGGGKQVLMKVNNNTINSMLYDQRSSGASPNSLNSDFAIYNTNTVDNNLIAYQSRLVGKTYIDGILNTNITCEDLLGVLHNITITCDIVVPNNGVVPNIGREGVLKDLYSKVALYDFMLFDNISTDDKIKELNTYIGITPKVTLPNYYWDNYGKKNTDANRGHVDEQVSLQKTGTSVNPLENFNISYEGMSGYNGYPVVFGASKTWKSLSGVYSYTSNVTNTTIHVTHAEHAGDGLLFSYVKKDGALVNIKEIPAFRVTVGGLEGNSKFGYRYLATEDATEETLVYLGNGTHELAKSFAPTEALLDLTRNVWVGIFITPMIKGEVVFDCDITIEVLPEYENGLAYDGVSDFSQNTEIEVVEDFTFLVKGSLLKGLTGSGGCIARKGDKKHYDTGGYAFIYCFDSPIESYRNSYYSFGKNFVPSKEIVAPPLIGYMTKTNVNGETTTFGTNSDIKGIIFGNWSTGYMNMVIYKSIFYTKTISLLEINFLKNLMEKDEIIDINHPIFISNTEDESNTSQDT